MYTLSVKNQYGEVLQLTQNDAYSIKSVIGLDPPDAIINTTRNAGQDGSRYNSSYLDNRVITITLAVNYPAEANRIQLYKYFRSKLPVTLYYSNGSRDVFINGYVQSMQVAYFDKKETVQITILCPDTLFSGQGYGYANMSNILDEFEFPFSIAEEGIPFSDILAAQEKNVINYGDIETGALITIEARGTVENPEIFNSETAAYMMIQTDLEEGDLVTINTRPGQKSITLNRAGVITSLIGSLTEGSTWLQLLPGDNIFGAYADTGLEYMDVNFEVIYKYQGV